MLVLLLKEQHICLMTQLQLEFHTSTYYNDKLYSCSHQQAHRVMFVSLQKWGGWAAPPLLPE